MIGAGSNIAADWWGGVATVPGFDVVAGGVVSGAGVMG